MFFFFFVDLPRIFTPAVNLVIFLPLYYHDKRVLSLTHPSFNFDRAPQFSRIKKFSSIICDWEEFKADTEKKFMKCLVEDFTCGNSEMVKTINYRGVGPFIPYLRRTLLKVLSYIGCTNVLSYLFYCNLLEDNICNLCTRLICNSPVLVDSFQKLESLSLPALMVTTHEDLKEIFSIFNCGFQEQEISINCFIDYRRVNRYKNDKKEDTNFANHPILISNHILTVGSRTAMNILHKNLFPVSQWRTTVLIREIGVFIVHIIKIICKQYFKHF